MQLSSVSSEEGRLRTRCDRGLTVVDDPLGVVVESGAGVYADDLKILDRHVRVLLAFSVRDVHEKTARERLLDVLVVRLVLERGRHEIAA